METTTRPNRKGLFISNAVQNVVFTFILVTSLFLIWGFCAGLIDSMDIFGLGVHAQRALSTW